MTLLQNAPQALKEADLVLFVDGDKGQPRLINPFEISLIDPLVGLGKRSVDEVLSEIENFQGKKVSLAHAKDTGK